MIDECPELHANNIPVERYDCQSEQRKFNRPEESQLRDGTQRFSDYFYFPVYNLQQLGRDHDHTEEQISDRQTQDEGVRSISSNAGGQAVDRQDRRGIQDRPSD